MTTEEFQALEPGQCFSRHDNGLKKQFCALQWEGQTLIAYIRNAPRLLIQFYPSQAPQLIKLDASPAEPPQSQGIPLLAAEPLAYAQREVKLFIALEGVLSEPRPSTAEPGPPIAGAINFVQEARDADIHVTISTNRPASLIRRWLQIHAPALQDVDISHAAPDDAIYLSTKALRFDGAFPSIDQLQ
jgi:hypothetical protein